jgi:hypothetical protein
MKLYHSASSPNSRRVRIFLAEKGLSISLVTVDLGKGEQHSDAYRAINPRRVVPTLVLEDGTAIGEVPAICRRRQENEMSHSMESKNKALVLEAFDTLFNKRDCAAAERFWSSNYVQHSAHIEPGREGLFNLIKAAPASLKYEPGVIVAEGDFVTSTAVSPALDVQETGSPPISCASPTACWPNTGTSSRMRRLARSRRAVGQCSVTASPIDRRKYPTTISGCKAPFPIQKDADHDRQDDKDSGARSPDFDPSEPVSRRG